MQDITPSQKLLTVNRKQEDESKDCECFASGSYCNGCNCLNCHNTLEYETTSRQEAIKGALERYPNAFNPKIADSPRGLNNVKEDVRRFNRGCNCKRSGCLKNYCGCYQANVRCSEKCRCQGCKNREGSQEVKQTTNAAVKVAIGMSCYLLPLESRKSASPSVQARGSSDLVQNQTVDYVVREGDTSLFTVPNNQAVPGSTTTSTYRSSLSDTIQLGDAKELCSLLVSKSMEVAKKMSDANVINDSQDRVLDAGGTDEKPMSPATRAVMSDDEHVNTPDKETPAPERTSQEKKDKDTEVYAEQERQILSTFRDHLMQLLNGSNIQKANTDPSRKEPEDEEEPSHRD